MGTLMSYKILRRVGDDSFTNDVIEISLNATKGGYAALGTSSGTATSGMAGHAVVVYVPEATGQPMASLWQTKNYGLQSRVAGVVPEIVGGGLVSGNSSWVVVKVPASSIGIPAEWNGHSRVITAHGPYDVTKNEPKYHSKATPYSLSFYNQTTNMPLEGPATPAPVTPAPPATPSPPATPAPPAVDYKVMMSSPTFALVNGHSQFQYKILRPLTPPMAAAVAAVAGATGANGGAVANVANNDDQIAVENSKFDLTKSDARAVSALSAADDVLEVALTGTKNMYAAVGFATAASGMASRFIACYVGSVGQPHCTVRQTTTYSVGTAMAGVTPQIMSSAVVPGESGKVVVRVSVSVLGIDTTNSTTQQQRVISARGTWDTANNIPQQHTSANTGQYTLNVYSAGTNMPAPAPATPAPAQTPAPTPIPAGNLAPGATSPVVTQLGGLVSYQWSVQTLRSAPASGATMAQTFIDLKLEPSGYGNYAGFGLASQQMSGPIVTCTLQPATGPRCYSFTGSGTSLPGDGSAFPLTIVSSLDNVNGSGKTEIVVRVRASDLGVSSGRQRSIFAYGQTAGGFPLQHSSSNRGSAPVDILTGEEIEVDRKFYFVGIGIVVLLLLTWTLVGAVLHVTGALLRPNVERILGIGSFVLFAVGIVIFGGFTYLDADHNLRSSPIARSFGGAATVCFWFLYFPLPKKYGLSTVVGSSFERALPYHIFVGICVLLVAAAHGIAFAIHRKDDLGSLFKFTPEHPPLAGFLAFCLLLIIVPFSLFARRKFYTLFRLVHLLAVPMTVLAILHRPMEIGLGMIPALLLYFCDVFLRLINHCQFQATVHSAQYFPAAKSTLLQIQFRQGAPVPEGGSFAVLAIPFAGKGLLMPHPFTIAWFDKAASRAVLAVKSMEGGWTEKLADAAGVAGPSPLVGQHVLFTGNYGRLQIKLGQTKNAVLVAGGIGVTPMLSILQEMAAMSTPPCSRVIFVWTVRERGLVSMLGEYFEQVLAQPWVHSILYSTARVQEMSVTPVNSTVCQDSITKPPNYGASKGDSPVVSGGPVGPMQGAVDNDPLEALLSPASPKPPGPRPGTSGKGEKYLAEESAGVNNRESRAQSGAAEAHGFHEVRSGRPDVGEILRERFGMEDDVAVYCCGPAALTEAAVKAAQERPKTFVHKETFEF